MTKSTLVLLTSPFSPAPSLFYLQAYTALPSCRLLGRKYLTLQSPACPPRTWWSASARKRATNSIPSPIPRKAIPSSSNTTTPQWRKPTHRVFFRQEIAKRGTATIRIPEVYHAFKERGITYIVMEHIEIDFGRSASDEQRAQALTELISIPPPPRCLRELDRWHLQAYSLGRQRASCPVHFRRTSRGLS